METPFLLDHLVHIAQRKLCFRELIGQFSVGLCLFQNVLILIILNHVVLESVELGFRAYVFGNRFNVGIFTTLSGLIVLFTLP